MKSTIIFLAHQKITLATLIYLLALFILSNGQRTNTTATNNTTITTNNQTGGNSSGTTNSSCGWNEVLANSGQDCLTCDEPTASCPLISDARCYCRQGYVRNASNVCILLLDCKKSGGNDTGCYPNATVLPMSSNCFSCDNYHYATCALSIGSKCYCRDGYVLDLDNHRCVYPSDCPVYSVGQCRSNQTHAARGYDCDTCANYQLNQTCRVSIDTKCYCDLGYVRDVRTQRCIHIEDCPGPGNPNEDCTVNQTFAHAGYDCASCDDPEATCRITFGSKCYCLNGHIRTSSGDCVQPEDCPEAQLPAGANCRNPWSLGCNPACVSTCRRREQTAAFCQSECELCKCPTGQVRDDSGNCIAQSRCRENPYQFPHYHYNV